MFGKVGLEEHFAIEETLSDATPFFPKQYWPELEARLLDIQDRRIREMDENGVEVMILSLNSPAVQAIPDALKANDLAKRTNDYLAGEVAKRPDRFRAFAALPMQDPEMATAELERCVKTMGFKGALVNGFSQVNDENHLTYYDGKDYRGFWRSVEALNVPLYLHPRNPFIPENKIFIGNEWLLGPTWGFGQQTAIHALRLIGSGLFDDCPKLQIILGHMGEGLPFSMWRIDHRNDWMKLPTTYPAKKKIAEYFRNNFYLTTSGNFCTDALINAISVIGADRIMFSSDWPFENVDHAANWFDLAAISDVDKQKIGRYNANRLFNLGLK